MPRPDHKAFAPPRLKCNGFPAFCNAVPTELSGIDRLTGLKFQFFDEFGRLSVCVRLLVGREKHIRQTAALGFSNFAADTIMNHGPTTYPASHIARALRMSKRTVRETLATIPPSATLLIQGNETDTWSIQVLPDRYRAEIVRRALVNGQSIADYLDTCAAGWQPKVSLNDVAESCLDEAKRLRAALVPALQRISAVTLTAADRVRLGLADYKSAFGHEITERHWRRLMDRSLWRDGGEHDFQRLELYLSDNPTRKQTGAATSKAEFQEIVDVIEACADPLAPTKEERAAIWATAFEFLTSAAKTPREQKQVRQALVGFLIERAPWLAKSRDALRVSFDWKFEKWDKAGRTSAALLDGRELKLGKPVGDPIPQDDLDRIIWHTSANCGGRLAQAKRDLAEQGARSGLTQGTLELLADSSRSKSYVNRRLSATVAPEVKMIAPHRLGKKAIDDSIAHVERDYSKLVSMQVVNADDFTFPVYFHVPDGNGWYTLTRGQCLLMLDVRSWKIIAWSLQPERNYNSLVIRTLMNRVCAAWGLPGTWYFERGIWQSAKLVKGEALAGWDDGLSWSAARVGWEQVGVGFRHAIRARTKPVERVGKSLQDLMEGERGYCGRDERRDCPARTKQAMDDVKFHRVNHPGELFYSFDEWETRLAGLIDRYNSSTQDGQTLQGMTPDAAFEEFWPKTNPPARMDATCWHLVAHFVKELPVTVNGISFTVGRQKFVYRNERTGQDRGKTVLAWFDPECPELLCVTDLNRRNPYLVERSMKVDFLAEAGDLNFEREISRAASHSKYPKARFHTLKAKFEPNFRRNLVDRETAGLAQDIQQQRDTKIAEQKAEGAQQTKARKAFGRLGMAMPAAGRVRPEQVEAAAELSRLLNSDEVETTEETK